MQLQIHCESAIHSDVKVFYYEVRLFIMQNLFSSKRNPMSNLLIFFKFSSCSIIY